MNFIQQPSLGTAFDRPTMVNITRVGFLGSYSNVDHQECFNVVDESGVKVTSQDKFDILI